MKLDDQAAAARTIPAAVAFMLFLALASRTPGATWHVVHDPGNPVDQVGSVAIAAADGDSIIVGPGLYYEHVPIAGKALTIVSSAGAAQTVLDGSQVIPGREGSIFYDPTLVTAPLVIEGFTLRGGTGQNVYGIRFGGAICWYNGPEVLGKSLVVRSCTLEDNHITGGGGDAIYINYLDTFRVESCTFQDNGGSTMAEVMGGAGEFSFVGCTYHMGDTMQQATIWCPSAIYLEVDRCSFVAQGGIGYCSLYLTDVDNTRITNSQFIDRGGDATATYIQIADTGWEPIHQSITMERNLFWFDGSDSTSRGSILVWARRQDVHAERNTFVACDLEAGAGGGAPSLYANNIFYRSRASLSGSIGGEVRCNDAWPEHIVTDVPQIYTFVDNISQDPLFCGQESGDFQVAAGGPCDPGLSPPGCGLIGAFGVGCLATPIERMSWGQVKARFRDANR
jgi:hypothetical protein